MKIMRFLITMFSIFLGSGIALATPITVLNHSFEDFSLGAGAFTMDGTGLNGFGWTVGGGTAGVFHPGTPGEPNNVFASIPDGVNTGFSHGPTISQVLGETLIANTTYTLQVGVGNASNVPFPGYGVQLFANGTLLAQDNSLLSPANGTFETSIITFNASGSDPLLGQFLEIRLVSFGSEINFDNVSLDAISTAPVPEPSTMLLLGTGLIFLVGFNYKRNKQTT